MVTIPRTLAHHAGSEHSGGRLAAHGAEGILCLADLPPGDVSTSRVALQFSMSLLLYPQRQKNLKHLAVLCAGLPLLTSIALLKQVYIEGEFFGGCDIMIGRSLVLVHRCVQASQLPVLPPLSHAWLRPALVMGLMLRCCLAGVCRRRSLLLSLPHAM